MVEVVVRRSYLPLHTSGTLADYLLITADSMFNLLEVAETLDPHPPGSKAPSIVRDLVSHLRHVPDADYFSAQKKFAATQCRQHVYLFLSIPQRIMSILETALRYSSPPRSYCFPYFVSRILDGHFPLDTGCLLITAGLRHSPWLLTGGCQRPPSFCKDVSFSTSPSRYQNTCRLR